MEKGSVTIFWFRRDLRLEDNAGLYYALKRSKSVLPVFIFDTNILNKLENKKDKRIDFIHFALTEIQGQLNHMGSNLSVFHGKPIDIFRKIIAKYNVDAVYCNHDYEPSAIFRDKLIEEELNNFKIPFHTYKDQVVFEKDEIVKDDGLPYTIFTPYSKKWKAKLNSFYLKNYPTEVYFDSFKKSVPIPILKLKDIGFKETRCEFSLPKINEQTISIYNQTRNFPAIDHGTTRLSVHLRFGTISIRKLVQKATGLNEVWLNELIWRDFYMSILWHFPHAENSAFKPKYNCIEWRNNVNEFKKWCKGETGYPIVDAGMRELNETGFMHSRVRMIVASFLTKHLLIDWRWGEAYFAEKLLDFDLSANNGGWQWAAGSGCDAAPYFRIFNPYEQTKKFDKDLKYIRKWVPEFEGFNYPQPIVDHKFARERVLSVYKKALQE
ncbi:MAG: deoxyribodipyrimidine photo-lyase [Chitinophagaceae bacterium]|jgi:deoxyribodipyrimidine photo-lyase